MLIPGRAIAAVGALLALTLPVTSVAQVFKLPAECETATGAEDLDDPVVLISLGSGEQNFRGFTLLSPAKGLSTWLIRVTPALRAQYNVFVTYTPFLTSDRTILFPVNRPTAIFTLPAAGVTGGREMKIWPDFPVTIYNDKQVVPFAFVDFIPPFVGSSPYTMQADAQGVVMLHCVQQVSSGYRITVYDQNHEYLYDGGFLTNGALEETGQPGAHAQPDPPP